MTSTAPAPRASEDEARDALGRLRALGTFAGATDAELRDLVASGTLVSVPAGWSLIWDRTPADKAYVILSGTVEVRKDGNLLATLEGGDVIGEVAILTHRLRTATVTATEPLQVLHLSADQLERLHAEVPAVRRALDAVAAERA